MGAFLCHVCILCFSFLFFHFRRFFAHFLTVAVDYAPLFGHGENCKNNNNDVFFRSDPVYIIYKGQKKRHVLSTKKLLASTSAEHSVLGPQKKFMCLISWERTQEKDPYIFYRGDFRVKVGVPTSSSRQDPLGLPPPPLLGPNSVDYEAASARIFALSPRVVAVHGPIRTESRLCFHLQSDWTYQLKGNGYWRMAKKRSTKNTPIVFAYFLLFLLVFALFSRFRTFWAVCLVF